MYRLQLETIWFDSIGGMVMSCDTINSGLNYVRQLLIGHIAVPVCSEKNKIFECHKQRSWVWNVSRRPLLTLRWHHNGHDGVSNHQPHDCLLNRLLWRRSKKTPKLLVTGLCEGNSSVAGKIPAQSAGDAENVSIWWRHHELIKHHIYNRWEWHNVPSSWKWGCYISSQHQ